MKTIRTVLTLLLALLVCTVPAVAAGETAGEFSVSTAEELKTRVNEINSAENGSYTIELHANITLEEELLLELEGKKLTLTSAGGGQYSILRADQEWSSDLIHINGGTVVLENIVIDGNGVAVDRSGIVGDTWIGLLYCVDANVTLGEGTILQNQDIPMATTDTNGTVSAVFMDGGALTIDGAVIRWNRGSYGAAVTLDGNASGQMSAGEIYGNFSNRTDDDGWSSGGSGAVEVGAGSTFTMSGGSITGNGAMKYAYDGLTVDYAGTGGVYLEEGGLLELSGSAEITGNYVYDTEQAQLDEGSTYPYYIGSGEEDLSNILTYTEEDVCLAGNFTGSAGVTQWPQNTDVDVNERFGTAYVVSYTGAGNFFCDKNTELVGKIDGRALVWTQRPVVRVSTNGGTSWVEHTDLQRAISEISGGSADTNIVELLDNVTLDSTLTANIDASFTLQSDSDGTEQYSITRGNGTASSDLIKLTGGTVRLENIVIDGGNVPLTGNGLLALIYCDNDGEGITQQNDHPTTLTLGVGAVLQNQNGGSLTGGTASAVFMEGGTLNIEDGAFIQNNTGPYGAAVSIYDGAAGYMSGGTITENTTTMSGSEYSGAVAVIGYHVTTRSTFHMSGGAITGNTCNASGGAGGVYLGESGGIFDPLLYVSGRARITGNTADGELANVVVLNNDRILLDGTLTGIVGVTWHKDNEAGGKFGEITGSGNGDSASNFYNDKYSTLVGDGTNGDDLLWVEGTDFVARTQNGNDGNWYYFATLEDAVNAVTNNSSVVELLQDLTLDSPFRVEEKTFTLRSDSREENLRYTIFRDKGFDHFLANHDPKNDGMIVIDEDSNVTLADIILNGNGVEVGYEAQRIGLVRCNGGTLTLGNGAVLRDQNGKEVVTGTAAAVVMKGGTLYIQDGAVIRGNKGPYGSAVTLLDGAVGYMSGGEIFGNYATRTGVSGGSGAVAVTKEGSWADGTAFYMSGGMIHHNGARKYTHEGTFHYYGVGGICADMDDSQLHFSGDAKVENNYVYNVTGYYNDPDPDWSGYYTERTGSAMPSTDANVLAVGDDKIYLDEANFTGSVGVTQRDRSGGNTVWTNFGYSKASTNTGAENFFNDVNPNIRGDIRVEEGGEVRLVWNYPDVAQIVTDGKEGEIYYTLELAIGDYIPGENSYIKMLADTTEIGVVMDKTVYLDLAGHTVTMPMEIEGGHTLYGFDSTGNGYETPKGKIVGALEGDVAAVTTVTPDPTGDEMYYLKNVARDDYSPDETTFHRFDMDVTGVVFRPGSAGIYFKSEFYGDETVARSIQMNTDWNFSYGVFLGADETAAPTPGYAAAHDTFTAGGAGNQREGSMVFGIVKQDAEDNADRTDTRIYVGAYFKFVGVDEPVTIPLRATNLTTVVKSVVNQYDENLNANQQAAFDAFWAKFGYLYEDESWAADFSTRVGAP